MASSVRKHRGRWIFFFSSVRMKQQGYPQRKEFTYNADDYKKSDIEEIRSHLMMLHEKGQWNPWTDPPPKHLLTTTAPDLLLSQATRQYIALAERQLAASTIKRTEGTLKLLQDRCGDIPVAQLTDFVLTDFVNSPENYHTRRTRRDHLNRFLKWMAAHGYYPSELSLQAYGTRSEKKDQTRVIINEVQLMELLDYMDQQARSATYTRSATAWQRCHDMTIVLFYMGLRMGDILHCRPAWILNDFRFLQIGDLKRWRLPDSYTPKSGEEHDDPVPIPPQCRQVLVARKAMCSGMYERMFGLTYARRYQERLKKASIKIFGKDFASDFSPHSLRHSCASFWLNEKGIAPQYVQHLLRHSDIRTTMGYHHKDSGAAWAAFHHGEMRVIKDGS